MKYIMINAGVYSVCDYLATVSRTIEVDRRTIKKAINEYGMWMGKGIIVVPATHVKNKKI